MQILTEMGGRMHTFNEMCAAYAAHQDRVFTFVRMMNQQARALRDGFAQSIGTPTERYESRDGLTEYVRLLAVVNGEMTEVPTAQLFKGIGEDDFMRFGIQITVERDRHTTPKRVYRYHVWIKWLADAIEVRLPDMDKIIMAPRDGHAADYSGVYAAITNGIMGNLANDPLGP